jgi:hypothetical protein
VDASWDPGPSTHKPIIINTLRDWLTKTADSPVSQIDAEHFCEKQFPQGFHSSAGLPNLRKPLRKDPFSWLNPWLFGSLKRRYFDANRQANSQIARGPRNIRAGRKKSALKNAKTPCTAIPAMRNGKRISQTMG